ncbi:hypothetical protein Hanom_Chr00s079386g01793001 [Helianthus anomalus]
MPPPPQPTVPRHSISRNHHLNSTSVYPTPTLVTTTISGNNQHHHHIKPPSTTTTTTNKNHHRLDL